MAKFEVKSNQYIPHKPKSLPSGYPACATYFYVVNEKGQTISKKTLKPYRGKQMNDYAFYDEVDAQTFVEFLTDKTF